MATSSGTQRAFALKRNKMTAADVRRHVMTGSLLLHPSSVTSDSPISSTQLGLIRVVDPLDVEDILSQRKTNSSLYDHSGSSTSPRRITDFPSDDIEVRIIHRDQITVESPLPSNLTNVESTVRDIIDTYNDDLSLVQRKYEQYSSGDAYVRMVSERPIIVQSTPRQIYDFEDDRNDGRSASLSDEPTRRDSYGSRYSSDSMCTAGSSSGGTTREEGSNPPHRLNSSVSDPTIAGVIQRISNTQLDQINEKRRQTGRQAFLVNLLPSQPENEVIERRNPPPFPAERVGQRLFIKILQLQLEPNFEPIFGSIALYDIKEKRKISETFHFDMNDEFVRSMISKHIHHEDEASKSLQAVFSISQAPDDVFIVFKLEKVLQACEVADAADPYMKDERNKERLQSIASQYCDRLGAYRMPLGWIHISLMRILNGASALEKSEYVENGRASYPQFDTESIISADRASCSTTGTFRRMGSGTSSATVLAAVQRSHTPIQKRKFFGTLPHSSFQSDVIPAASSLVELYDPHCKESSASFTPVLLANLQPLSITLNSFFRQEDDRFTDEEICKILAEDRKGSSKLSRLKTFPATLKIELSGSGAEDSVMRLTPELLHIHPYIPGNSCDIVREVAEFPKKVFSVNASYRNLLYVYPKSVNLTSRSGPSRNISVRVELMDGRERNVVAVFGKSSCPDLSTSANTCVYYHNKTPSFSDEIKILIPVDLNDGHHLLFTFYHIACKPNKVCEDVETAIGYSWIPLFVDGRLQTGDFCLPISQERLPTSYGYLSSDVVLPNVKWLDGHKPLFSVSLKALTTVHTQDKHLDQFFSVFQSLCSTDSKTKSVSEAELRAAIRGVIKAQPEPMIAFLYVILDKLLALIVNPPFSVAVSKVCFEILGQLVKICTVLLDGFCDGHGRSSLLTTYIHFHKITLKDSTILPQSANDNCTINGANEKSVRSPTTPESQQLFDIIKDFERSSGLRDNDGDGRNQFRKITHEEIALQWVLSDGAAREMAFLNSWFFLELMIKSMAEHLSVSNRLYLPRRIRFSENFTQHLSDLSRMITSEIIKKTSKDPRQSQSMNSSWAFFLRDAFSLMDRSFVMNLVKAYNHDLAEKIMSSTEPCLTTLMLMKIDFTRIICSHEHFVALNLPFGFVSCGIRSVHSGGLAQVTTDTGVSATVSVPCCNSVSQTQQPSPTNSSLSSRASSQNNDSHASMGPAELTVDYRSQHFLIGLVLADLSSVLETTNTLLHSRAIGLVRNLLATHEADSRLLDTGARNRVASLYLPLVGITLDSSSALYDPYDKVSSGRNSTNCHLPSRMKSVDSESCSVVTDKVKMVIGGLCSSRQSPPLSECRNPPVLRPVLTLELTRQLLTCFCWVLKNMERSLLRNWIRALPPHRLSQFLDVLQLAISCFEFKSSPLAQSSSDIAGDQLRYRLKEAILGENSSAKELLRTKSRIITEGEGVRWRKEDLSKASWKSNTCSSGDHSVSESEMILEKSLCTEVLLVVLDSLELVMRVTSVPTCDSLFYVLPSVLRVLMHILSCNQSVQSLENVFASQRAIVIKYPNLLFEQETEQCAELCLHLLRHCASRLAAVRSQAAASLYLLMRQSFESGASLSKVKMQITMSLSTLVSTGTRYEDWINEDCLRRSLKTVLTYSEIDASTDPQLRCTTFAEQVKDLAFNLHMILSDTVKMKEYTDDFEMLLDLMYRVAKGYQNNPDLRLTWLLNMAKKHEARENSAEAAQCLLHAAALAAEYISMRNYAAHLPKGAVSFIEVSDNVLEESAVSDDVVSPDNEGICESRHFTENGLVDLVEKTAEYLGKAQMYESMLQVYKVIMPILEANRDYHRIAKIHQRLAEALSRIEPTLSHVEDIADAWFSPLPCADKRCFGTYFRVGFYGNRFNDLDGVEFIYKEPSITKLPEVSHRLENFYSKLYGMENVEVIKDSNLVDRNKLDSSKAYIQITYVEPYLEGWERRRRATHFERNTKLSRFVYATPFTKDGRSHGCLKEQYKRRTILCTQFSFPYVKTRCRVISRESFVLTPIEVAIEDIEKKTRELAAASAQVPPDAKMLQMVLQGCIGTTVNQGPLEVANVFLNQIELDDRGKPIDKFQNKLRLSFKNFSKKCSDALHKNKQLIQADQQAYQDELEKNYIEFTKKMAPVFGHVVGRKLKTNEANGIAESSIICQPTEFGTALEFGPSTAV